MSGPKPDAEKALRQYRRLAPAYDVIARFGMRYRRMAVDRLKLGAGEVVVDVACGTGLNFKHIVQEVGPSGHLIGIDLSPDMLTRAHARIQRAGWSNVSLIESPVEAAAIPQPADAALFSFTHDVMRSEAAVKNVITHVKPGGRVSVLGAKWAPGWLLPVNVIVWLASRGYVTTLEGYDRPWTYLEKLVPGPQVEEVWLGAGYLATGRKPAD